jgi:hypothetical protein
MELINALRKHVCVCVSVCALDRMYISTYTYMSQI